MREVLGFAFLPAVPLGDFDLNITKVSFSLFSFSLLLVWVFAFLGTRRPSFQTTVPVVADEGFAFVLLCAPMRVNVVNVGKESKELGFGEVEWLLDIEEASAPFCQARRGKVRVRGSSRRGWHQS